MSDHVYKIVNIVGTSKNSIDEAIHTAVEKLAGSGKRVDWFEVVETRGHVAEGKVAHFQVVLKIGYRFED